MSSDPRVPESASDWGQWHTLEIDFMLSNYDIDWERVDIPKLVRALGYVLALAFANGDTDQLKENPVKMHPLNLKVVKKELFTDSTLWDFIQGTGEEKGDDTGIN